MRHDKKLKPVFYFIVEGCTEENYLNQLKSLFKRKLKIKNCQGGSPKKILETALDLIQENQLPKNKNNYSGYFIIFDADTDKPENQLIKNKILSFNKKDLKIRIIIPKPCFETWLLLHFEEFNRFNDSCDSVIKNYLEKHIPEYNKNDCVILDSYITKQSLHQALEILEDKIRINLKNKNLENLPVIISPEDIISLKEYFKNKYIEN